VGGARTDVELEERAAAAIKTVAHVDVVAGRARAERKQQQRQNRGGGPEPHSALLRLPGLHPCRNAHRRVSRALTRELTSCAGATRGFSVVARAARAQAGALGGARTLERQQNLSRSG